MQTFNTFSKMVTFTDVLLAGFGMSAVFSIALVSALVDNNFKIFKSK